MFCLFSFRKSHSGYGFSIGNVGKFRLIQINVISGLNYQYKFMICFLYPYLHESGIWYEWPRSSRFSRRCWIWYKYCLRKELKFSIFIFDLFFIFYFNFILLVFLLLLLLWKKDCGVRLIRTNLREKDVAPLKEKLAQTLFDHIPVGVGSKGKIDSVFLAFHFMCNCTCNDK